MTGRPSKYDPGIHTQLVYWMAKNGLTDIQIAKELHISEATINNWKNKHPEFLESIKKGKDMIDVLVVGSLLKRAWGYSYEEITKASNEKGELLIVKTVTKHQPGDVGAQFIWMKNRMPTEWRDKKEIDINSNMEKLMEIVNTT